MAAMSTTLDPGPWVLSCHIMSCHVMHIITCTALHCMTYLYSCDPHLLEHKIQTKQLIVSHLLVLSRILVD